MNKKSNLKEIYIDASSFAQPRKSGIGYVAEGLARSISEEIRSGRKPGFRLNLVVSLGKSKYVTEYNSDVVRVKTIPLPYRGIQLLNRLNLLPPVDLLLGKGIYIFPNYRNWRLIFSKSLTYIHDLTYLKFPEYTEPKNLGYLVNHVPQWAARTDTILTGSDYTREEIIKYLGIPGKKVAVIHHGIDSESEFVAKTSDEIQETLSSYGVSVRDFILHVGNIEPRKNIIGLLNAYKSLSSIEKDKHPLLLIGGNGWSNQAEKELIKLFIKEGVTVIQPNKYVEDKDLPSFYSAASVLVMPSFYEGFGLPPLQAIACGTPTVVSRNSSLSEIFSGIAILVDPTKDDDIKIGIHNAITMNSIELAEYRKKAKKFVLSYSWAKTSTRLFEIMEHIDD